MKTFILGISTGLFLNKHVSHLPQRKLWAELIPHSHPDLYTWVRRHARDPAMSYHWSVGSTPLTRQQNPAPSFVHSYLQGPLPTAAMQGHV